MQTIISKNITILVHNGKIVKVFIPKHENIEINQVVEGEVCYIDSQIVVVEI